jgi:hypothetical protein
VVSSTISGNSAVSGGGIDNNGGIFSPARRLKLFGSIVAGNISAHVADVDGGVSADSACNLVGNGFGMNGMSATNHNHIGTSARPINPMLAPLGDYGGPTQTMLPLLGSAALGQGGPVASLAAAIGPAAPWLGGFPTITTFTVNNTATFIAGDTVRIDGEQMVVINAGSNTLTVIRGANGTMPAAHGANAGIYLATNQASQIRSTPPNIGAV